MLNVGGLTTGGPKEEALHITLIQYRISLFLYTLSSPYSILLHNLYLSYSSITLFSTLLYSLFVFYSITRYTLFFVLLYYYTRHAANTSDTVRYCHGPLGPPNRLASTLYYFGTQRVQHSIIEDSIK